MDKDIYINLVYKELESTLSDEEKQQLDHWEKADPANAFEAKLIRESWVLEDDYAPEINVDLEKEYALFQKRKATDAPRILMKSLWLRVAAISLLLITVGGALVYFLNDSKEGVSQTFVANTQESLFLPDQSEVTLSKGSTLTYPNRFGETRSLGLTGEAYFQVEKNTRPFIVETPLGTIQVIGTAFNVDAPDTTHFSLAVSEGLVQFTSREGNRYEIAVGNELLLDPTSRKLTLRTIAVKNIDSWRKGALSFSGDQLESVVLDIGRHYNVDLVIDNERLYTCPFTSTFESSSLEQVLETLRAVFQLSDIQESVELITLMGGVCPGN